MISAVALITKLSTIYFQLVVWEYYSG